MAGDHDMKPTKVPVGPLTFLFFEPGFKVSTTFGKKISHAGVSYQLGSKLSMSLRTGTEEFFSSESTFKY